MVTYLKHQLIIESACIRSIFVVVTVPNKIKIKFNHQSKKKNTYLIKIRVFNSSVLGDFIAAFSPT